MATQMPPMEPDQSPSDYPDQTPTDSDYEFENFVLGQEAPEHHDEDETMAETTQFTMGVHATAQMGSAAS